VKGLSILDFRQPNPDFYERNNKEKVLKRNVLTSGNITGKELF